MKPVVGLTLATVLFTITACSSSSDSKLEPAPTELTASTKKPTFDMGEYELFTSGKQLFFEGLYSISREYFEQLRDSFPMGPHVEFAEIKIADTHFLTGEYPTAAALFEDFAKNRPNSDSTPYALLMAARSYQLTNTAIGRDVSPLEKSLVQLDILLQRYGDSRFAQPAREMRLAATTALAENEQMVADFYSRRDKPKAAEARQAYYATKVAPIIVAHASDLSAAAAGTNTAPIALNEPVTMLASSELTPGSGAVVGQGEQPTTARAMARMDSPTLNQAAGGNSIRKVSCRGDGLLFIYLNNEIGDRAPFKSISGVSTEKDTLMIRLPNIVSRPVVMSCFKDNDLRVSEDGVVTIDGRKRAELFILNNPPRLMLDLE